MRVGSDNCRIFWRFHIAKSSGLYVEGYIRSVSRWFPENRNNKKTVILAPFCIFSFCQYGRQRSLCTSGSALITAGAPRRSSPPCYFSYPHLSSYRRPPEREWRRPARTSPTAASQRVSTLSQPVKELWPPSLRPPHTSWIAPSSSQGKTVFSPTSLRASPFSWEGRKPFWPTRQGPEWFSWHSLAGHSPIQRPYRRWKSFLLRFLWSAAAAAVAYTSPLINGY